MYLSTVDLSPRPCTFRHSVGEEGSGVGPSRTHLLCSGWKACLNVLCLVHFLRRTSSSQRSQPWPAQLSSPVRPPHMPCPPKQDLNRPSLPSSPSPPAVALSTLSLWLPICFSTRERSRLGHAATLCRRRLAQCGQPRAVPSRCDQPPVAGTTSLSPEHGWDARWNNGTEVNTCCQLGMPATLTPGLPWAEVAPTRALGDSRDFARAAARSIYLPQKHQVLAIVADNMARTPRASLP